MISKSITLKKQWQEYKRLSLLDKFYMVSLGLICSTMILPNHLSGMAITFSSITLFLDYRKFKKYFGQVRFNLVAITSIGIFVLLGLSLSYTKNLVNGFGLLERALSLFVFPILISKLSFYPNFLFGFKKIFVWVVTIGVLICFSGAIYESFFYNGGYVQVVPENLYIDFFFHRFTYHQFSGHIGMHAVYFSAYTAFSSLILLASPAKGLVKNLQLFILVLATILLKSITINFVFVLGVVYILFKRNYGFKQVFFALSIGVVMVLYLILNKITTQVYFFQNFEYNLVFIGGILGSLLFTWVVLKFDLFSKRKFVCGLASASILGYFLFTFSIVRKGSDRPMNNLETRLFNWQSSVQIIKKNPLLGVGVGDVSDELEVVYGLNNLQKIKEKEFNEHSQYLNYWSGIGILGLSFFMLFLFMNLKLALSSNNDEYFGLTILCMVFCFTESVFLRSNGLIFFVFFMVANSYTTIKGDK
jgi:hypothetical protein